MLFSPPMRDYPALARALHDRAFIKQDQEEAMRIAALLVIGLLLAAAGCPATESPESGSVTTESDRSESDGGGGGGDY